MSPPADIAGEWDWTCCDDRYDGTMTLRQSGTRLSGTFRDVVDESGGNLEGTVDGTTVRFTRVTSRTRQDYTLRVLEGDQALEGTFVGAGSAGTTPFRAERSTP